MVENTRLSFASQRLQHVVDRSGGIQFGSFVIDSYDRVLSAHCLYLNLAHALCVQLTIQRFALMRYQCLVRF